jgi:hypothetical protein
MKLAIIAAWAFLAAPAVAAGVDVDVGGDVLPARIEAVDDWDP